jgi:diguanylate cyclase (GGDEF)-like protein
MDTNGTPGGDARREAGPSRIGVIAAAAHPLARSVSTEVALRRRQLAVQLAFVLPGVTLALAFVSGPGARTIFLAATAALAVAVGAASVRLRARNARLVSELRTLATHDALTGALNRGAFEEFLAAELARLRRSGRSLSVAALDLDNFKRVNDDHGHAAGDDALRRVARLVARNTRGGDVFARIGGEEFALLLTDTDVAQAETLAESLRALVEDSTRDHPIPLTVSVGVAGTQTAPVTADLVAAADRALYEAKRNGRNRVVSAPAAPALPGARRP